MDQNENEWFEDDAFWEQMFPFMFPDASFVAAAENVPKIVALTGISGGSVLDLACGPGRYAVPLAQAGFNVTGVDRTVFLLDKARDRATPGGAKIEWVEQDMRQFVRPAAFDLAINLFTSFGYFDEAAANRRVLENVYESLRPGGTFVFDHLGKEVLATRYQPTRSEALLTERSCLIAPPSSTIGRASTANGFILPAAACRNTAFATGFIRGERFVNGSRASDSWI